MHVNGDVSILADLCFYSATFAGDFKCKLPWERCTNLHSFFKNAKFSQPVELYLTVPVKADVSGMFDGCTIPDDSYITVQGGASADACYMFNKSCIGANSVINLRDLRANDFSSAFIIVFCRVMLNYFLIQSLLMDMFICLLERSSQKTSI